MTMRTLFLLKTKRSKVDDIPDSMKEAIRVFILIKALRIERR